MIREVGEEILTKGTPAELPPMICCFLGTGKTSQGAREIYSDLPVKRISLAELPEVYQSGNRKYVYELLLEIPEMYRLKADAKIDIQTYHTLSESDKIGLYLNEPEHFESNLDQIFPYCTMMMNCIIWSSKYPRLITREIAKDWYQKDQTLKVIGDITCDPEGAIEFSKETWIDDPVFIYNP